LVVSVGSWDNDGVGGGGKEGALHNGSDNGEIRLVDWVANEDLGVWGAGIGSGKRGVGNIYKTRSDGSSIASGGGGGEEGALDNGIDNGKNRLVGGVANELLAGRIGCRCRAKRRRGQGPRMQIRLVSASCLE
jgi:hypothetical protein